MSLAVAQTSSIFEEAKARASSELTVSRNLSKATPKDAGGDTVVVGAIEVTIEIVVTRGLIFIERARLR